MSDVSIFVSSFDQRSMAWEPFCHAMRKYWPDRPWPIQFVTNYKTAPCGESLKVGKDKSWSETIRKALGMTEAKVILLMMEDYWLTERPDTQALKDFARIIQRGKADHIRLLPSFKGGKVRSKGPYRSDPRLCVFTHKSWYRACCLTGFWSVLEFKNLLRKGETVWEFEKGATERSRKEKYRDRFLCVREHKYLHYIERTYAKSYISPWRTQAIMKGKWQKSAQIYAEREGLEIDFSHHPDGTPVTGDLK